MGKTKIRWYIVGSPHLKKSSASRRASDLRKQGIRAKTEKCRAGGYKVLMGFKRVR
jgi:hypothetical protein